MGKLARLRYFFIQNRQNCNSTEKMSLAFDDPLIKFTNFKFTFCTALELNIQGVSEFGANI